MDVRTQPPSTSSTPRATPAREAPPAESIRDPGKVPITLRVNGRDWPLWVEPRRTLLDALRIDLGLTGAKLVCGRGECGACTILADGVPVYACLALALEQEGRALESIEGLSTGPEQHPLQRAFIAEDAYQCGFCTPGQIMALKALLDREPAVDENAVRHAVSGNLCRCGAYQGIVRAGLRAAADMGGR